MLHTILQQKNVYLHPQQEPKNSGSVFIVLVKKSLK